jgi:uncharacterized protein YdaU (DUF1376 family)
VNYYERYCGDYASKTSKLSLQQHGAYTLLLDEYYSNESPLPADYRELYRICRAMTPAEREAVRFVADKFFPVNGDGSRHNEKADEILIKALKRINASKDNGKNGGRPPKEKPSGLSNENPAGSEIETQQQTHSGVHQTPDPKNQSQKLSSGKPDLPPGFVRFWTAWPKTERKQGKAKCAKLWKRKGLEASSDVIVAHVEKMAASESWRTGFDPMPETYLNGDRWDGAELDAVGKTALGECQWNVNGNRDPDAGKCSRPAVGSRNNVPYCQTHLGQVH